MKRILPLAMLAMAMASAPGTAAPPVIDALRWSRRVILVSAAAPDDPGLLDQRRILAEWRREAEDRDVTVVEVVGTVVEGLGDTADTLRRRFALPPGRFAVALIGKDGTVAARSAKPLAGDDLARTIDAMPMRRAGQR